MAIGQGIAHRLGSGGSELGLMRQAIIGIASIAPNYGAATMTLAEVLPGAQQLTAPEKLKLIRILAEDLDSGPSADPTQTDAETVFWLQASQSSLDAVWNNDEDDVYAQLC
jgi:hypothetical protein